MLKDNYKKGKDKSQTGVSLIELMLAIAIFVISAATVAHLFVGSQTSMSYSLDKLQAIFLAKQGVEEVRAIQKTGFNNIVPDTNTDIVILNGKDFERTVVVSSYSADRFEVVSTVEWKSVRREEEVSYSEFLTDWVVVGAE